MYNYIPKPDEIASILLINRVVRPAESISRGDALKLHKSNQRREAYSLRSEVCYCPGGDVVSTTVTHLRNSSHVSDSDAMRPLSTQPPPPI
jgi:hypothetical protein